MNDKRLAVIKHAFQFLDEKKQKKISFDFLQQAYRAAEHPRVKTREKLVETIRADFINSMSSRVDRTGFVTEQAFMEYYADINACLPEEKDDYFVDLILKTWGLSADKAFVSNQKIQDLIDIIFEKVRQKTHGADDEGKTIMKIFRHFDLDGYGTIEPKEFEKALETLGCVFGKEQMDAIFKRFD